MGHTPRAAEMDDFVTAMDAAEKQAADAAFRAKLDPALASYTAHDVDVWLAAIEARFGDGDAASVSKAMALFAAARDAFLERNVGASRVAELLDSGKQLHATEVDEGSVDALTGEVFGGAALAFSMDCVMQATEAAYCVVSLLGMTEESIFDGMHTEGFAGKLPPSKATWIDHARLMAVRCAALRDAPESD